MIFSTEDPLGKSITLPDNSWKHIIDRHPEFTSATPVQLSVENPNVIRQSTKNPDSDIYYSLGTHPKYPRFYVATVVAFSGDQGEIHTAHLSRNMGSGGVFKYVKR